MASTNNLMLEKRLSEVRFSNGMTVPEIIEKYELPTKMELELSRVHDDGMY
jgi:hypothetical protein